MKIVNLTPHNIKMLTSPEMNFPPEPVPARVAVYKTIVDYIQTDGESIPVLATTFGGVENLPDPIEDTIYIVSRIVLDVCPKRYDLFFPDNLHRDESGQIVGAGALGR